MPDQRLDVVADLRLEIDGDVVQVSADGERVRVTTDRPTRLLRRLTGLASALDFGTGIRASDLPLGGRAAELIRGMADAGLTVTLAGPRHDLLHVGADAGPGHIRPAIPPRAGQAAAGLVAVAVVLLMIRTRRR